jgi:hypothetical protein
MPYNIVGQFGVFLLEYCMESDGEEKRVGIERYV